jgi:hypothetical protein
VVEGQAVLAKSENVRSAFAALAMPVDERNPSPVQGLRPPRALELLQNAVDVRFTAQPLRPVLNISDQGLDLQSRSRQALFHRADVVDLCSQGAEQSPIAAAGKVTRHQAANFFESEACALGAGDDVQRHERSGRIGPIAVLARQSGAGAHRCQMDGGSE